MHITRLYAALNSRRPHRRHREDLHILHLHYTILLDSTRAHDEADTVSFGPLRCVAVASRE
jgi:hypothetical protein